MRNRQAIMNRPSIAVDFLAQFYVCERSSATI